MLTSPGRANNRQILLCANPFQTRQVIDGGLRDGRGRYVEAVEGLDDGERGGLSRLAVVEASRAAISASIRVRSTSSGAQRCVLAVNSTSGAVRRTVASFSRRNPASRSAARGGTLLGATGLVYGRAGLWCTGAANAGQSP
jgi:hypothetical protein